LPDNLFPESIHCTLCANSRLAIFVWQLPIEASANGGAPSHLALKPQTLIF
jgi:hypothetical protein